jgi:hypothetical protein
MSLFKDKDEKLLAKEKENNAPETPGYMTQDDLAKQMEVDKTAMLADLSHQLEEARNKITHLEITNRNLTERMMRGEAARDAMRELLMQIWKDR